MTRMMVWLAALALLITAYGQETTPRAEILWDSWGVPHIFAQSDEGLAYGFGWAQMRSHGDLILRLYAEARGSAAEYFGEGMLESDILVHTVGLPELAESWYEAQSEGFRGYLDAFAAGINDYAEAHGNTLNPELTAVLPVTGRDVVAHSIRAMHFTFIAGPFAVGPIIDFWQRLPGSNGWAIAPGRSESGNALLLGNPHLPWADLFLFYEVHMNRPGYDFYGATLVGFPIPALGFNDNLGWTHTVNTYDGADLYELTLAEEGYLFDGEVQPFEAAEVTLRVLQKDGTQREETLTVPRSLHGPVVAQRDEQALALRVAGLDRPGMMEQWWDMTRATNLEEFESVLRRLQIPMFNVIYADREGNILQLFNALVPLRAHGDWDYWFAPVPGHTSETLWSGYHTYEDLPRVVNPQSGWLQNANEPPWYMTVPYPLEPEDFPGYLSPVDPGLNIFRPQRSQRMLLEDPAISFEAMVNYKFNAESELAGRILDELIEAAQAAEGELAREAAEVLAAWDRSYHPLSIGAPLFFLWTQVYLGALQEQMMEGATTMSEILAAFAPQEQLFAIPFDPEAEPLTTPAGLRDPIMAVMMLEAAAAQLQEQAGTLLVPWGEVARMRVGEHDLPASGGSSLETFRVLTLEPAPDCLHGASDSERDGRLQVTHGDSFIFAVEFSEPVRAEVLTVYGNATQPGSPHVGDQLELYLADEMRPVWRMREEIEANLRLHEELGH